MLARNGSSAGAAWHTVASGHSIGHARIHRLPARLPAGSQLRLRIAEAAAPACVRSFAAFSLFSAANGCCRRCSLACA